jgi:hopene-associated glycosyltransferase HpnB
MLILAILVLIIWLYLLLANGLFWRIDDEPVPEPPLAWPDVTAIIPARNEEEHIAESIESLLDQRYPGRLRIVVVDDHSDDGTSGEARHAARSRGRESDLLVLPADPLPERWAGKVWAMQQGVTRGLETEGGGYVLFCDADVLHGPGSLRELVCRTEWDGLDLASFMIRLKCESPAERLMVPAFVFFFRMLYPFRRANNPADRLAGAAGGMMLVRRSALERIDNLTPIHDALIDDCSLAREIKRGGHRIWLGMSRSCYSLRGYGTMREIVRMIARTAYTQLDYSPLKLAVCFLGLLVTFVAPLGLLFAGGSAAALGAASWLLMSALYLPMVRFYCQPAFMALLLPVTACLYLWATLVSAWNHVRGQGGQWKGRAQSAAVAAKK